MNSIANIWIENAYRKNWLLPSKMHLLPEEIQSRSRSIQMLVLTKRMHSKSPPPGYRLFLLAFFASLNLTCFASCVVF